MNETNEELFERVQEQEAGVADLIDAYELADYYYRSALGAPAPYDGRTVASNSSSWDSDANLG